MASKMMITMGLVYAAGKIEFNNENLMLLRGCYIAVMAAVLGTCFLIRQKIESAKNMKKIFVPPPPNPMQPPDENAPRTQTTYYDHEMAQLKQLIQQTVIGGCISFGLHYKMEINQVLLIQSVMQPVNLFENKLIQKYILGNKEERPWGETYEGERSAAALGNNDIDKLITDTWDAGAEADFAPLLKAIESDVDHKTGKDGWTTLMIASGTPLRAGTIIRQLVEDMNASLTVQDNEGWTALHWAAFHGRADSAEALLAAGDAAKLCSIKAADGRTPLQVADEEVAQGHNENEKVAAVLRAAKKPKSSKSATAEVKPTTPAVTVAEGSAMHEID